MSTRDRVRVVLLGALLAGICGTATAQGTITGVSTPGRACQGDEVRANVTGTGRCQTIRLVWNIADPTPENQTVLENWNLESTSWRRGKLVMARAFPEHVYDAPGVYELQATPVSDDCSGTASTQIRIISGLGCELRVASPRILTAVGEVGRDVVENTVEPGGRLHVWARHHRADRQGTISLAGGLGNLELEVEKWGETEGWEAPIIARIPDLGEIGSLADLTLQLSLTTADGQQSNQHALAWAQERRSLGPDAVEVVACSAVGNGNRCNAVEHSGATCATEWFSADFASALYQLVRALVGPPFRAAQSSAIVGSHYNCWGAVGNDSGTDIYRIALRNGWVLDEARFGDNLERPKGDADLRDETFPAGSATWDPIVVDWAVTPADGLVYTMVIWVRGPKGFPPH